MSLGPQSLGRVWAAGRSHHTCRFTYVFGLKHVADHLILLLPLLGTRGGLDAVLGGRPGHAAPGHQHHDVPNIRDVGDGAQGVVHHGFLPGEEERVHAREYYGEHAIEKHSRSGSFSLDAVDNGARSLFVRGRQVQAALCHCAMFSSFPGLRPLDAGTLPTSQVVTVRIFPAIAKRPLVDSHPS